MEILERGKKGNFHYEHRCLSCESLIKYEPYEIYTKTQICPVCGDLFTITDDDKVYHTQSNITEQKC